MFLFEFQSSIFVFVRAFSKTLIVDCAVFSQAVMAHYIYLAGQIEVNFPCFQKCPQESFSPSRPMCLQNTYIKVKFMASNILQSRGHLNGTTQLYVGVITALKASNIFCMCSVIALFFPIRGLKSRINFCSQSCTNIKEILTKYSAPQGGIRNLRLADAFKLSSKETQPHKGMDL